MPRSGMDEAIGELKRLMGSPASVREPRVEMLMPVHPQCPPGSKWDVKGGTCKKKSGPQGKITKDPNDQKPRAASLVGGEGVEEGYGYGKGGGPTFKKPGLQEVWNHLAHALSNSVQHKVLSHGQASGIGKKIEELLANIDIRR